jgi:hypothetical protein
VHNITGSPVFDPDPEYGLGMLGREENGYTVVDGASGSVVRVYPEPHRIVRRFDLVVSRLGWLRVGADAWR